MDKGLVTLWGSGVGVAVGTGAGCNLQTRQPTTIPMETHELPTLQ